MTDEEKRTRKACDLIVHRSAKQMLGKGASIGMVLDRLLTFSAGQEVICYSEGELSGVHTAKSSSTAAAAIPRTKRKEQTDGLRPTYFRIQRVEL